MLGGDPFNIWAYERGGGYIILIETFSPHNLIVNKFRLRHIYLVSLPNDSYFFSEVSLNTSPYSNFTFKQVGVTFAKCFIIYTVYCTIR